MIKNKLVGLFAFVMFSAGLVAVVAPAPSAQAACSNSFLGIPAWYDGLTTGSNCDVKSPADAGGIEKFLARVALNVINILLRVVGYVAVGFIIFGGFVYLTSGGESDRIAWGRKIIMNAVIGLVIAMLSVVIVTVVAGRIG